MPFPIDYDLPPELIAQEPLEPRDRSRLLHVDRQTGRLGHHHFFDLPSLLSPGDLLVLNDTRVLPARLLGRRQRTGGRWEGLFLHAHPDGSWEMLCQTGGRPGPGEVIEIEPGPFELVLEEKGADGRWRVRPRNQGNVASLLEAHGRMPLPPYIRPGRANDADRERYQTVYAQNDGAVAAPTAGLHFTPELFARLAERGIEKTFVTLHVGLGTFQPIKVDDYREHPMHYEWGEIGPDAVKKIEQCRGRVIAVGTTAVRVLESAAQHGSLKPWSGATNLYIFPPFQFRVVQGLITNFHLPKTTLLLLVAAFAGIEPIRAAYQAAIAERYRFYSYGDAMLIV